MLSENEMDTTRLPECKCPTCDSKLDAATPIGGHGSPEAGDLSICFSCGEMLEYDENLMISPLSEATVMSLDLETRATLLVAQTKIRNFRVIH